MAIYALNILGRADEPTGRAEVVVAPTEEDLQKEFSAFLSAASAVVLTNDRARVAADLAIAGWAMPTISEGDRLRLYRCDPLPVVPDEALSPGL